MVIFIVKIKIHVWFHYIIFIRIIVLTQKTDVLENKFVTSSLVSWWTYFGEIVFEPQSEGTEEKNSKWGRDRQSKYKLGNTTFKWKPAKYLSRKGRSCVYSSFSFIWCPTALWCRCTPLQCPKTIQNLDVHTMTAQEHT